MKKLTKVALGTCLLTGSVRPAFSQEDRNAEIMKQLYSKIVRTVTVDDNNPRVGQSFLMLANPGILIDPTLDLTRQEGRRTLSLLLDRKPAADWIYKPTGDQVVDIYKLILNYKDIPRVTFTDQDRGILQETNIVLYKNGNAIEGPSEAYSKYLEARQAYETAAIDVELSRDANGQPDSTKVFIRERAYSSWIHLGFRREIETAQEKRENILHRLPETWWSGLKARMALNEEGVEGLKFPKYITFPAYSQWVNDSKPWSKITFSDSDIETEQTSSSTSIGGGIGGGWGLWRWSAAAQHSRDDKFARSEVRNLSVSMELMRVEIYRPWMENLIFRSRAWRYGSGMPLSYPISTGSVLSSGTSAENANGIMPFIPVGLLLARKVKMSGNWSDNLETSFNSRTSGNTSIGWGPLSFGGRYYQEESRRYTKARVTGNTIEFDAPQIIGYFCEVINKSPHPDPSLPFSPPVQSEDDPEFAPNFLRFRREMLLRE